MNTKIGLHHLPTHHLSTYPPQTFRAGEGGEGGKGGEGGEGGEIN